MQPLLSLIIPCKDEEFSLLEFYAETDKAIPAESELIFVDDGSTDGTAKILKDLAEKDNRVHYIILSRNFGKEAAMLAGLKKAKGNFITIIDADLQDPPSLIPQMLEAVQSGVADCAATRRVTRKGEPVIRSFFAHVFYKIISKVSDMNVVDGARDFRLMSRKYANAILEVSERNRFSKGIFPWIGFRVKWFEFENIKRATGETKWSFWKLFLYSLDGIVAFSAKPLAIASVCGILLFLASFLSIAFVVVRKIIYGDPVSGWASTICVILFCSGIQLLTIGILGQYLAKIYTEVKSRPHFIASEET
jgi:glycosyltransferase involved in cell wall biosynthesis